MSKENVHIQLDAPVVGEIEKKYLSKAIDNGYVSTIGPFVSDFENDFAKYIGVHRAVSVQSGTAALHMALIELGISSGDEVIIPNLTFVATVNPVLYVGAIPVLVDVDRETFTLDPEKVRTHITAKTKAIIPVHLYGNPADLTSLEEIAEEYKLYIIEDATESLGTCYKGKKTGTYGNFGCFSFNGNKIITTGGGGMIVGRDQKMLAHIAYLTNQANDVMGNRIYEEVGYNYRLTNIEAALGLAQMSRLTECIQKRATFYSIYKNELSGMDQISFQKSQEECDVMHWLTCITVRNDVPLESLRTSLLSQGIPTRRIFCPLDTLEPYKQFGRDDMSMSHEIYDHGLCLPSSGLNSEDDIYYVCKKIKECICQ